MFSSLESKADKIAVIGLGYVGLPIALEFAKKFSVIGFDINSERVELMKNNIDPSDELDSSEFEGCDITFTHKLEDLKEATFFIVAVPTPINNKNLPDLTPLLKATETVGKVLKKGDYVVFESTVYPGCTEEDCVPVLEEHSGLKFRDDFMVGYSPERINPGDKVHTLTSIVKVVAGCCDTSKREIAKTYGAIITAGIHEASSIKVAEAAKIIENTQRDVNIALMNELSMIFDKMEINTYEVLEASGTKWNFLKFFPGLVGGHCIGVDPYYLTHKAQQLGHHPRIILSGRSINDGMGAYIAKNTVKRILGIPREGGAPRVLVLGVTFKENVSDIRNSKVADVVHELHSFNIDVDVVDPYASSSQVENEYGFSLAKVPSGKYDGVVLAVNHKEYIDLDESYFRDLLRDGGLLVDVKGIMRDKISNLNYWSL